MSIKNLTSHVNKNNTPQSEQIDPKQTKNSAGGWSFQVDDWGRLDRFLILGSDKGSYYASERKLTKQNAKVVLDCASQDPARTVARIAQVSQEGRAPKNDPAIFALGLLASYKGKNQDRVRKLALDALPSVCRIPTHLFHFTEVVNSLRGWGRGLRSAIGNWYQQKPVKDLVYQVSKYQQRDGWSNRDLLRLSHPKTSDPTRNAVYHWMTKGWDSIGDQPHDNQDLQLLWAFERAKRATSVGEVVKLVQDYGLVREHIPTQYLNDPRVWEVLLEDMPITAMIRNLNNMTKSGLLAPLSSATKTVVSRLGDLNRLKKGRVHPVSILMALRTYSSGRGLLGSSSWTPVQPIVSALDDAFYLAFDAVEPTNKNWFFGLDVSGSMGASCAGTPMTCAEGAAALAMVGVKTEPWTFVGGFATNFVPLGFNKKSTLDSALRMTRGINFGGTDCSLPPSYALQNKMEVDAFVVITDSETWAGYMHAHVALEKYRQKMGRQSRFVCIGMTSNGFTISSPEDPLSMDVVGFSTDVPNVITEFVRG